jgi:PAS domain S-box-containing protein
MAQGTAGHFANPAPVTSTGSRNYVRFGEWKIRPLLAASFAAIVFLMIVGDVIAVLQLDRVETQAWRFYQADQKSLAITHVYVDVVTFRDTLTGLARDQNPHEFASRATALRDDFLRDVTHAQQTLSSVPDGSQDPTILIRLETVRAALPVQVDSLLELVKVEDWQAVRFRLAGQVQPLVALSSSLVADVEQEVAQERARALESVQRTRRQLYLVLPITALLILLMAAMLGWYATRRISRPLAQLDAGAQALARGEFGYQVELRGNDELADLAGAFNYAARQLQKLYDDTKRNEAHLADSKAKLEEAQRIAHVGYWEWDLTSNHVSWSDETYRIYGLQPQEFPVEIAVLRKMIHPEDLEFVFRVAEEAVRGGLRTDVEHRIIRPSGDVRTVHSQGDLKKDASGRPCLMFGTVQDITDRKCAEQRLRESEAYLAEAQRLSQTGNWAWNPATGDIRYWSEMCYRVLGFDPAGPLPRFEEFFHRIHPDDQAAVRERFEKAIRDKADFELDYRVVHPEKGIRDIHVVGHAVLEGSSLLEFVGTVIDVTERKRAEAALQQSQLYLAEGQCLAHMGSWAFNAAGFEYWSSELFRIYGLDPGGKPPTVEEYLALVHPEDRAFMKQGITNMLADHLAFDFTKRIVRPDGEIRHVRCVGVPVTQGEIFQGFLGTAMDVTEQERLTEELRLSERYLSEGQRLACMGSWAFNSAGVFDYWSEELFRIYGLDPQKGAPTLEQYLATVHPQDRDFMADTIERMHAERSGCDVKKRIVRPDGELRYIRCVGIPVMEGEVLKGFLGTAIDITEQELLTQELERQQAYLAEAQKLTHTASWAWRVSDRRTVHLSDEFYRIYGFDPAQGAPTWEEYSERVYPEDRLKWTGEVERVIAEKVDYDHAFRILLPNGMVKWIRTVGHPVVSNTGDLEQFVGSSTDITELKAAEQQREKLRQLEADLAHTNRVSTLGEMAASLAHEIKQPIAAAITSANSCIEWLAHDPPNLDRARAAAGRIDKYGNRAAEIIDRIRSFYRKSPPGRELVDVNGIIQEMLTLLNGEATRHSVAMGTELAAELPKIIADHVQLQQVFMNLMLNAIEAMKDSGGELTVKSELQNGQLQFSVSDTGAGLPMEKMDQIFSAFFTTKPYGSGMGLAISRSIVESHGGRLWATANEGRGATFSFTLPAKVTESSPLVA